MTVEATSAMMTSSHLTFVTAFSVVTGCVSASFFARSYVTLYNVQLHATYGSSEIHDEWRHVYRSNPRQFAFDEAIYDWLFDRIKPTGVWLDAGCGSGDHSIRLARRAANVVSVDISPVILEVAKEAAKSQGVDSRIRFECHALEDLPRDLQVNNVHCRGVLMHIPDWRSSLENLCRCLKPGGNLVIFETNARSLEGWIVKAVRRFQKRKSRMEETPGGLEFWSEVRGEPFLVRLANLDLLEAALVDFGVDPSSGVPRHSSTLTGSLPGYDR